jgi:hypothetical protein
MIPEDKSIHIEGARKVAIGIVVFRMGLKLGVNVNDPIPM